MTITESYPIHRCIYRNDPKALSELLADSKMRESINEYDNHGNTPLHLALMLSRHNCVIILLDNNCDVFSRNFIGWNPLDEASILGDYDVIKKMSYIKWKEYINTFIKPNGILDEWNSTTPNLYLKAKLKLKTTIPLLQKFGAKDIQKFYKKGRNLRLDTTLGGIDLRSIPRIIKGNISVIIRYEENTGTYKIYLVNHKKKLYQEFYPNIPEWYLINSLKSKVAANTIYKFFFDLTNFDVKPVKGNVLKKTTKTFTMEDENSYKCVRYKGKKAGILIRKRNDEAIIGECESIIKKDIKEEKLKSKSSITKKLKKKGSSYIGRFNSSKSKISNDSDDEEGDSDSSMDDSSDDDDDDDETTSKVYSDISDDKPLPEFLDGLYGKKKNNNKEGQDKKKTTVTYTIDQDGQTKTFEKVTSMEDTLDWEQAYHEKYAQNTDFIYSFISGNKDNSKIKHLNYMEIEKLKLKKITEEEYFNPASTGELHLGRIMDVTESKKTYKHKIKFWMAKESSHFPISSNDVQPLFKFIMMILLDQVKSNKYSTEMDKQAYTYLTQTVIQSVQKKHSFPVKTSIPLYPSIAFETTLLNVSKDTKYLPDDLFEIPKDYTVGDVYIERIQK